MISGTIIGEIKIAMIAARHGTWLCDRPFAAKVPNTTASKVAKGAIKKEFLSANCQSGLVKKSR